MAEEVPIDNGVESSDAPTAVAAVAKETVHGLDHHDTEVLKLKQRIEALEKENEESRDRIANMTKKLDRYDEIEAELEQSYEHKKALDSVAARALELETQVSRLQHDLISAMNDGDEANKEVEESKKVLDETDKKLEEAKKEKLETEKKVTELQRKIEVLEKREIEEKSKKIRAEEEMRERISANESEVNKLKKRIIELETEVGKKEELKERLRESEFDRRELEGRLLIFQGQADEAEKVIAGMKEKTVHTLNGIEIENRGMGSNKVNLQPVVAAGSVATVAVAVAAAYVFYARRR